MMRHLLEQAVGDGWHGIVIVVAIGINVLLMAAGLVMAGSAKRRLAVEKRTLDRIDDALSQGRSEAYAQFLAGQGVRPDARSVESPTAVLSTTFAGFYAVAEAGGDLPDAEVYVEQAQGKLESCIFGAKFIAQAGVLVGLLGTLIGLSVAVGQLGSVEQLNSLQDLQRFGQNIGAMLQGFRIAFYSAAAGVVVTLVLGWSVSTYEHAVDIWGNKLRRLLSGPYASILLSSRAGANGPDSLAEALVRESLARFDAASKVVLDRFGNVAARLVDAAAMNVQSAEGLKATLAQNTASLEQLCDVLTGLRPAELLHEEVKALRSVLTKLDASVSATTAFYTSTQERLQLAMGSLTELGKQSTSMREALDRILNAQDARSEKLTTQMSEVLAEQRAMIQRFSSTLDAHRVYADEIARFVDGAQVASLDPETLRILKSVSQALGELQIQNKDISKQVAEVALKTPSFRNTGSAGLVSPDTITSSQRTPAQPVPEPVAEEPWYMKWIQKLRHET